MVGLVWFEGKGRSPEKRRMAGGQFLCLRLGEGRERRWGRRQARLGARELVRAGVRRAVFPMEFGYERIFAEEGVRRVETVGLQRAAAGAYIRRRLEEAGIDAGRATVAVAARRAEGAAAKLTRELSARYRYVLLDAEEGGEALAAEIRRETGAAVTVGPGRRRLEAAEALVCFDPWEVSGGNEVYLELFRGGRGAPLGVGEKWAGLFPPGTDGEALAAALWMMGAGEAAAFIP